MEMKAIQNNIVYDVHFRYDPRLVDLIRQVPGRSFIADKKFWTIPVDKLGFLQNLVERSQLDVHLEIISDEHLGENANIDETTKIPDIDISDVDHYVESGSHLFQHQVDFLKYAKAKHGHGFILADEQGCISGDAIIKVNIDGCGKQIRLDELHRVFHRLPSKSGNHRPDPNHTPTFKARCLNYDKGIFELNTILNVLDKGVKPVYKITLSDGKILKATADHEILTPTGFVQMQNLSVGGLVVTNGVMHCKNCGSTEDVCTYEYVKFYGYCRKCMYKLRNGTKYKGDETGRCMTKDGYVLLKGVKYREHPNYKAGGILEHHWVMSQHIGRPILPGEVVHHINGIKTDNRIENLQLMTIEEHCIRHSTDNTAHLQNDFVKNGKLIIVTPKWTVIDKIEYAGEEHVYDIVMAAPYHNFIANGIVVHNCGKTAEIINYALYRRKVDHIKHCLVICCVNSAKYAWRDDIKKHTNGAEIGYILGCRKKRNGELRYSQSGGDKLKDLMTGHMYGTLLDGHTKESTPELPFFIIMNIEAVRYKSGKLSMKKQIIQMIKNGEIGMIALDEVHKNISPKSEQGKAIKTIKEKTRDAVQWIPMTGTPIVNKPTDVFLPLMLVDGHNIDSFYKWEDHFVVYGDYGRGNVICYKNIPILKKMLQGHMIRRTKESVLDLPDKVFYTEYVENTKYQERLYMQVQSGLVKHKGEVMKKMNPLAEFTRLRQVNGCPEVIDEELTYDDTYVYRNAKLKRLLEIVDEIILRDEKVVIFSNWVQALKPVYHFLQKKYKVCCFTGTMTDEAREKHKRVFCNNPNYKIMIGTIGALGTAQTLTVANNVILYDEPWNAATRDQAIDRCHRISATKNVNIYTLLSAGTIDEIVHSIIFDKECTSQYIVDGKLDIKKNPELFDMLLGSSK